MIKQYKHRSVSMPTATVLMMKRVLDRHRRPSGGDCFKSCRGFRSASEAISALDYWILLRMYRTSSREGLMNIAKLRKKDSKRI